MPKNLNIDTFQVTMTGNVDTIDASSRGGSSIVLKNPTGNSAMYIGPATNEAGSALASTTGFLLEAGASLELDLMPGQHRTTRALSVKGALNDKLHVLVVKP